ncbi:DUF6876 family protein [Synechococcus sp. PCC 6312]|uniref:DUF6876 family protein n=1 Tax=Synechococcus sp. (strain ATCC 27167 / PCC 6312) TaxID=195253 RepID=UPI00029F0D6D|nr:DUF6876 family protein [Synechococcus sp. PCC 6312]AFY61884.1 hypothetical protein Syn6312_2807 [Synechococcus sp. PCC 6312]
MVETIEKEKQKACEELKKELGQFHGTTQWYRFGKGMLLTDGTKALGDAEPGHYWLLTLIASYQGYPKLKKLDFQVWTLKRDGTKAVVTCQEDTGKPNLVKQSIPFTDTPLDELKLFVCKDGNQRVILLPSEY